MPRFSERYGHVAARQGFQIDDADEALRSNIWNIIALSFIPDNEQFVQSDFEVFCRILYHDFFRKPVDDIATFVNREREKDFVLGCPWHQLYDLVEYLVQHDVARYSNLGRSALVAQLNKALEVYHAGYRVVEGTVTPITDEVELRAIDGALAVPAKYAPARKHIETALGLFSSTG